MNAKTEVWDIVPHLSGVPRPDREQRTVMVTQFYIDESGKGGDGPIFELACLEASASEWAAFTDDWIAVRDEEPAIDYFSMAECWAGQGEFRGIEKFTRWRKAAKFAEVTKRHVRRAHCFFVDHELFKSIFVNNVDRRYDDPYFFMATDAIEEIIYRHILEGGGRPIEFIFDQQPAFEADVLRWFTALRDVTVAPGMTIPISDVVEGTPTFKDEKKAIPLQAADMVAWNHRRFWSTALYGEDFTWYLPLCQTIEAIPTFHIRTEDDWLRAEFLRLMAALPEAGAYYHGAVKMRDTADVRQSERNRQMLLDSVGKESVVFLETISTRRMRRYVLVDSCPSSDSPHLHSRASDRCLLTSAAGHRHRPA